MGAKLDNTIVLIPSYNEARTIGGIVKDVIKMGLAVLVIDDGSVDSTECIALDNGAMALRHKDNVGKGYSVRQGLKYVMEKTTYKWAVIMDGDGQHHTEDILVLMEAAKTDSVDMVIGNRMLQTETMPIIRYMTNRFMSWLISRICGQYIPDTQCGFRLVNVDSMKKLELLADKYDIESEMLIESAEEDMTIKSVPIRTIYGEEKSAIRPVRDTIRFFSLIVKYHLRKYGFHGKKKKNG